jgi:hypothetical protein
MLPALLGLIAAEFAAAVAAVFTYRRRLRLAVFFEALTQVDELVTKAVSAGRRSQVPQLSLAQRAACLEETRAALEQASAIMRATPMPLELVLRRGVPALPGPVTTPSVAVSCEPGRHGRPRA